MAGVSVATVSYVLNENRPVRAETRDRVLAAVKACGYKRNISARNLRRARTDSIGVITPDAAQYTFAGIIRGIESEARANNFTLLLANSGDEAEHELESINALQERQVDGLIVAQVSTGTAGNLGKLHAAGVPVVAVDRYQDNEVDYVGVETVQSMYDLTAHALGHGHRAISLVAGDTDLVTLAERRDGFLQALRASGTPVTARSVLSGTRHIDETAALVKGALASKQRPTALVAGSFQLAVGALQAVQESGLSVPDDIAFFMFDEFPYTKLFRPSITNVVQPAFEIGREAMRLLIRRIHEPDARPVQVRLKPWIELGNSCGCVPDQGPGTVLPRPRS